MSLENKAAGVIWDVNADTIYTGGGIAGFYTLYTPPSGKRINVSDLFYHAQDSGEYLVGFSGAASSTVKRRLFLVSGSGITENRTLPLKAGSDEALVLEVLNQGGKITVGATGEYLP